VPPFLDEAAWVGAFGAAFQPAGPRLGPWAFAELLRLLDAWTAAAPWRTGLGACLQRGARRLAEGRPAAPLTPDERELLVLTARSHLASRNVLKKDNLELGLVGLYWRIRLSEAARGPTSVIDTLVASNKLPKDRRLGEFFRQNQVVFRRLAELPVESLEVT
jgi:hypothetical protein